MGRYSWSRLNSHQVGRFAEYFVKMEFALYGFEIYSSEVDDRGIDFVARHKTGPFYEVQVKSMRKTNYVFMPKDKFPIQPHKLLALVILAEDEAPELFVIPAIAWLNPDVLLKDYDYEEKKSKPEYGIQLSKKSRPLLDKYEFAKAIKGFMPTEAIKKKISE